MSTVLVVLYLQTQDSLNIEWPSGSEAQAQRERRVRWDDALILWHSELITQLFNTLQSPGHWQSCLIIHHNAAAVPPGQDKKGWVKREKSQIIHCGIFYHWSSFLLRKFFMVFFFFKFTFESVNWAIVIRVPWITAVYVGTCAAKSCQSANACFPPPTLAERPSTKAQWPQAQDCLWSGKSSRPSFVLLLLGTTKASTPCRVEKYLNVSRESRVKLSDSISAILPVSGSVWGSWLGGPTDMWWPAYHAWNWIGPQPPDMSYCESPASLSSRGTCFPCI